ncbi:DUF5408 family protein [Helicobacter canadensis]|uniref:Uncharacterized protein n=1 Tax=Helicobacter canadensis MIT 98-5491 TaxID=537970 RepID=C5ZXC1_9HELI|nr:DUF5408 family protein [Helicobacter canadensis]EES89789.1 hypothetical protein HCAN_1077 [Helicobacter canadensis MIT 98-5491]EFR48586.1 hypothetical protein HCMG_00759 [Helicobacter canadensis MIT 98-5491]STO99828.1 Uncharacterised protein [Helicobacter canadensis]
MENLDKKINHSNNTATRAIKIALVCCVITIIFATLSLWVLLNQITATANLSKNQKILEQKILILEKQQKQ